MSRYDARQDDELRPVRIITDYLKFSAGSVSIEWGENRIICAASVVDGVPPFLKDQGRGWLSGEYSLLPYSTPDRTQRETGKGGVSGRTQEIQRLIGRSLRSVMDFSKIPDKTVWIDCDVVQADGGTRTASVTGAFVALALAMKKLRREGVIKANPLKDWLAAVSVGKVEGRAMLDLCYREDSRAEVDMNVIMTGSGEFVEVQGTAEGAPFARAELNAMLDLAQGGIARLIAMQKDALGGSLEA